MLLQRLKRLLLFAVFLFLLISRSSAQTTNDYQTFTSGDWNNVATWSRWNGTSWVNPAPTVPVTASLAITILSTHTVTVTANVTGTNSPDQLVIAAGGALTVNAGITFTVASTGANPDLSVASGGTITNSGTIILNASSVTTITGKIVNSGTITPSGTSFTFAAGSLYQHNFPSPGAVGTIPTSTWNVTSTCEILSCGNTGFGPSQLSQNFGNFIWNNSTQPDINLAGTLTTIAGNFTLSNTNGANLNLVATNAGGPTTVAGSCTISNGNLTILKVASVNKGNQMSVASYSQTGGTMTIANCSGTVVGANVTNGQLTVSGTSTITGGTLNVNSGTWTGSNGNGIFQSGGLITISTPGIINGNSSAAIGGTGVAGTITATLGMTINAGAIVNLNTSTTTGSGGSTTLTANGLITLAGGTLTGSSATVAGATGCNSTIQANAGFTMTSGTLNLTPGNITGGGGTGFLNITGALAVSGGTVNVNSSTATAGTTGSNGSISVSTTCTFSGTAIVNLNSSTTTGTGGDGTLTVTGAFLQSAGTFNLCSTSGAATGDGTLNANSNCTFNGGTFNITSSTTSAATGGNGIINVIGNFVHTTAAAAFARTATSVAALGTINVVGTTTLQTLQSTSGFSGSLITFNISQSGLAAAKATVPAATTFTVNSGTTFNINDNSANTGTELQIVNTGAFPVSGIVNVNNDATLDLVLYAIVDAGTGGGFFNLNSEGHLMTRHAQGITTLASGATGCIRVTGGRSYHADASYTYYGNAVQATGNGLPTSLTALSTLTINNTLLPTSGGVTLTLATTTLGTFTLTSGRFITSTALFTIGDGGICTSTGSITAFVDGPIKKIGFTATTPFIYPTGDVYNVVPATGYSTTAKWARIAITSPSTSSTDAFTAEYHKINDPCDINQAVSNSNGSGIDHVSFKEYWDLTRVTGSVLPTVKLYWEDNSSSTSIGSAISTPTTANLHVAEFDGTSWQDRGVTGLTVLGITGNLTTSIANTFTTGSIMPFTFSGPTDVNPLPVELVSFHGTAITEGNLIDWSTATETNSDYFELERSSDGNQFETIYTVEGQGTSTALVRYNYLDAAMSGGMNYYRLNQHDFDGKQTYSRIISIDRSEELLTLQVYPNPSADLVNIISSENMASVIIYNMLGEIVFSSSSEEKNFQFRPLSKGIYVAKAITKDGKESSARFVRN